MSKGHIYISLVSKLFVNKLITLIENIYVGLSGNPVVTGY